MTDERKRERMFVPAFGKAVYSPAGMVFTGLTLAVAVALAIVARIVGIVWVAAFAAFLLVVVVVGFAIFYERRLRRKDAESRNAR